MSPTSFPNTPIVLFKQLLRSLNKSSPEKEMVFSDHTLSVKSSGLRSNFSQTCNRLSQYLKHNNGTFPDLKLGLTPTFETKGTPTSTVNLISGVGNETEKKTEPGSALTIFYDGQVMVFDDFPAEKAKEIMTLASKSSGVAISADSTNTCFQNIVTTFGTTDLPIARRNSLARFLEKRKDRKAANVPYYKPSEEWLGMGNHQGQWLNNH